MIFRKAACALTGLLAWTGTAMAAPREWETGLQPAVTPVMERVEDFNQLLTYLSVAISLFVLALIVWVLIRYNRRANPVPSKTAHHTLLEVVWTIVPVIILVIIAVPSFKLLYYQGTIPKPDLTIEAIGKQWFWTYAYPKEKFQFDSLMLSDEDAAKAGDPRLLGADNPLVVPVNAVVEVETTGADVIHSWAVPAFGVKMDAVPGRINKTWFKATKTGTYYGQCSELCGARHAFMPIEVRVVSQADYEAWLTKAKQEFAANAPENDGTRVAALGR
ncbi:MAG: cytochrome c oxidase subunit II [Alphaproteobacteria bacterium]|jgi:cytochrome c oxidase subunit 2|nr:cytochrome c oxidase subunit II [Alphaproteobacteria bacterium]OJU56337.1 MAG: cytochrome c oxidase subunit II [Alphaproteobacteria bacterium 62-8]MBN9558703.1 cytochrome c oxidase subunit II [Alphaproteobacteria bacterium]MBN9566801.1 cytochrome c oxidase subunit II [Alphaproteobacteria bacterium]MBN9571847.1 cytochrome c oxidase subunit II [Alphaproteobacteria bacterium]